MSEQSSNSDMKLLNSEELQNQANHLEENQWIRCNVVVAGVAVFLLHMGFLSSFELQRSLNDDVSLTKTVITLTLFSRIMASIFLPAYLIRTYDYKTILVFSSVGYVIYLMACLDPRFSTLIPTSVLAGCCFTLLWTSFGTCLTRWSVQFADISKINREAVIFRCFSGFFLMYAVAQILSSLLEAVIINPTGGTAAYLNPNQVDVCGMTFCEHTLYVYLRPPCPPTVEDENSSVKLTVDAEGGVQNMTCVPLSNKGNRISVFSSFGTNPNDIYALGGCYVVLAALACFLVGFLIKLPRKDRVVRSDTPVHESKLRQVFLGPVVETGTVLKTLPLLIPLGFVSFYYGLIEFFLNYDYIIAYVLCSIGRHYAGLLSFCEGIFMVFTSVILIWLNHRFNRTWIMLLALFLAFLIVISLIVFFPTPSTKPVFFILSFMWGIVNIVFLIYLHSLFGFLGYTQLESAFSNLVLWSNIGRLLAFSYSHFICVNDKVYILLAFLFFTAAAYLIIEFLYRRPRYISRRKVTPVPSGPLGPAPSYIATMPPSTYQLSGALKQQPFYQNSKNPFDSPTPPGYVSTNPFENATPTPPGPTPEPQVKAPDTRKSAGSNRSNSKEPITEALNRASATTKLSRSGTFSITPERTVPSSPTKTSPTPGKTEPSSPKTPSSPKRTEPSSPNKTDPSSPSKTEPSSPNKTAPSSPTKTPALVPPSTPKEKTSESPTPVTEATVQPEDTGNNEPQEPSSSSTTAPVS